jgi:hypothetical protein
VEENDARQPLRGLRHNPKARRPTVSEIRKKDLVNYREGDKFLSSTVKYVGHVHMCLLRADHETDLALVLVLE